MTKTVISKARQLTFRSVKNYYDFKLREPASCGFLTDIARMGKNLVSSTSRRV